MSTTVSIPTHVSRRATAGYGPGEVPADERTALTAAAANRNVRGLTPEQRATFAALHANEEVEVVALTDAIVAALGQAATRLGQSMARRYQRDLLLRTWEWLQAGAPTSHAPSWTTGTTVTLTVIDGALVVDVDLSEITDRHAAEEADDAALDAFPIADARCAEVGYAAKIVLGAI